MRLCGTDAFSRAFLVAGTIIAVAIGVSTFFAHHPDWLRWLFRLIPFLVLCFIYFYLLWVPHLFLFLVVGWFSTFLPTQQPGQRLSRICRCGLFFVLFLVVGSLFNGLWGCTVYMRLYESSDYAFGFLPFWPLTQSMIEARLGADGMPIMRVSLFELQLIWLIFAAATWGVTLLAYRAILKHFADREGRKPSITVKVSSPEMDVSKQPTPPSDIWKSFVAGLLGVIFIMLIGYVCGAIQKAELVPILLGVSIISAVGHLFLLRRIRRDATRARKAVAQTKSETESEVDSTPKP